MFSKLFRLSRDLNRGEEWRLTPSLIQEQVSLLSLQKRLKEYLWNTVEMS